LNTNNITIKGEKKMDMKELKFGIEIELIRIERRTAAEAIQSVVGGRVAYEGGPYDCYTVNDLRERRWKVVTDSSLCSVPRNLQAEVVSPILTYGDIPQLQEVVRALKRAGAARDKNCGVHVHIDASVFNAQKLANFAKIFYKQENLILHAFDVKQRRLQQYTRPISDDFIRQIEASRPTTSEELNRIWYGYHNTNPQHYDRSRYRTVNFHNVWYRGTLEIRLFESTLHAGRIKSYLQFALCLAMKALNSKAASSKKREFNPASAKYDFRVFLISSLKMNGPEFKTARYHLLKKMPGDSAWKNGRPQRVEA
jgi:hypothetical protein